MAERVRHGRDGSGAFTTVRVSGGVPATAWHGHASVVLGRVDRGTRILLLPHDRLELKAGDGFVIPPDVAHAWSGGDVAYRVLTIDPTLRPLPPWAAAAITDPEWKAAFDAAHAAVEAAEPEAADTVAVLIARTAAMVPNRPPPGVLSGAVLRARRFAAAHLDEALPLAELGAKVGMSPWHLHRLYRRSWGLTPAQHRLEARLRAARALLLSGHPVAEAAAATGFADQSHFCRAFRRLMGVPPAAWLRQIRRGTP